MERSMKPDLERENASSTSGQPSVISSSGSASGSGPRSNLASVSTRSRLTRHFTLPIQRNSSAATDTTKLSETNAKGPFGITTLHHPADCHGSVAQVIFVHGLGGGSEHTWSRDGILWPRDLLSRQDTLETIGIHTFGYDSDFKKTSTLNIQDFSRSLLHGILNNPLISAAHSPIILVAHSLGGLVIKKAYILARQTSAYSEIAQRIKAMIFVATPHAGSGLAPILDKIFRLSSGSKPYLEDLRRNSDAVQAINAEFPSQSLDLILYSFYETNPLSLIGLRDVLIVPKTDAVLNYPHEQSSLLYGDHRSVCKFSSATDHNFIAISQAIASCLRRVQDAPPKPPSSLTSGVNEELDTFLGIWEPPADDLYRVKAEKLQGTCSWLTEDHNFKSWLDTSMLKIFWVRGAPGTGKSFAAGHAIEVLENSSKSHCYYFFRHGDKIKSSMENFLLSMAWQMASVYDDVRSHILHLCARDPDVAKSPDHRTLHRKLWEQGIFRARLDRKIWWVLDAFDECQTSHELSKFVLRVHEKTGGFVQILVTSRTSHVDCQLPATQIISREIEIHHTQADIARYLDVNHHEIPGSNGSERNSIKDLILAKSNGCFLWAILVLKRLSRILGSQARLRALEETPPGMDQLYSRIVTSMSIREKQISRTILTWVSCAVRPLTTTELKFVIESVAKDEVDDIGTVISKYCHDLVYVDTDDAVKMRHASTRKFLLRHDINRDVPEDDLTIQEEAAHQEIAMACLEYLNGPEMKAKPKRKMVVSTHHPSVFAEYACHAIHEHVNQSSASDSDLLGALATFLQTNVLSWMEHLASCKDLETVLHFAQVLKTFLRRKSRTDILLGDEVVVIDAWANDLVKLVSKFGTELLMHPESILSLIPPFCPSESAPHVQFARSQSTSLSVLGLSSTSWDDRLCTVVLSQPRTQTSGRIVRERLHSVGTSRDHFCIGTSTGRVVIFNEKTCLEENIVDHGSPVISLKFAETKPILACASRRRVQLWNTESWEQQWQLSLQATFLSMAFVDDDQLLLTALTNNTLLAINLIDRSESVISWIDMLDDPHRQWYYGTPPQFASFNTDLGLLALGYRCLPVLIYSYDAESYQVLHSGGDVPENIEQQSYVSMYSMEFSKLPDTSLLAVSYSSGDLVLFDTELGNIQATTPSGFFPHLVSTADGRTLAAARTDGDIDLYDFETLHRLYRVRPDEGAVSALTFTADSTRFLVLRAGGHNCRILDPVCLYRRDVGHNSTRSPSFLSSGSQDGIEHPDDAVTLIGAITCDFSGDNFFVGKDDNSVSVFDTRNGNFICVLFSHVATIKSLQFVVNKQTKLLISTDSAGFLAVHTVGESGQGWIAKQLFIYKATVTGVQQFLCDETSAYLLVCSNNKASVLYMVSGESVGSQVDCTVQGDESYVWANHPTNKSLLLRITSNTVHVFEWSSMTTVSEGIELIGDLAPELQISGATTIFDGPSAVLIAKYAVPGQPGKTATTCFSGQDFSTRLRSIRRISDSQAFCDAMQMIVGMFRDRLVFLHVDGWICSIKASGLRGDGEGIMHHFAPPIDWLRTNRDVLVRVSRVGDVLFVVRGEIAVVKRGLTKVAHIRQTRDLVTVSHD